jgi:hypothetical protein
MKGHGVSAPHSAVTERIQDLPTDLEELTATVCPWGELERPSMPALPPHLRFFARGRVDEDGVLGVLLDEPDQGVQDDEREHDEPAGRGLLRCPELVVVEARRR